MIKYLKQQKKKHSKKYVYIYCHLHCCEIFFFQIKQNKEKKTKIDQEVFIQNYY